ncbi:acyltransferase family protein [Streptomyces sp. ZYX-F-203]
MRATERRAESPAGRDDFFDNAKFLAILLVGVGHTWGQIMSDNVAVETLYRVVYAFHMPAFIVIAGYFSRGFDMSPKRVKRLLTGVLVPYLVFEVVYTLHRRYAGGSADAAFSLLNPGYMLWFLCALFVWRLTTPIWRTVRWPLPIALGIAALASASPGIGDDLDLQRLLQFLPFFVLGLVLRPEHFAWVRRRPARIAAVPVAALAVYLAWWTVPVLKTGWLYHNAAAQDLGAPWWQGPVHTLILFGTSVVLTGCFFALVPGRRVWFTALGAGTLYAYLSHGLLVKQGEYSGWFESPALHGAVGAAALTVLAATVMTLLCTPPVRRVMRFMVEPRMEWAFRKPSGEPARRDDAGPPRATPPSEAGPPKPAPPGGAGVGSAPGGTTPR